MKPQDIADLKQLIEFLKEHQIAEFDLDRGDLKIRLKFNQQVAASAGLGDLARLLASAPAAVAQAASAASHPASAAPAEDPDAGLHIVKSPIVGTFYGSPSP
ncbi:MAG: acetyl-CoA carboxylase, biotin carboxyl carrier protein, partial [Acidobacteriota bacterium]|nr:acetyl-CoA carboxylase, biotin carboxyl carrier protein [Acidobacteriota bacterium]